MTAIYHRIISSSPAGPVRLVWKMAEHRPQLIRILLSRPMETGSPGQTPPLYPAARSASCVEIERICAALVGRLEGDRQEAGMEMVDLSVCSSFQHSVLQVVRLIPFGMVSSYHQVADLTGNKKAARAVGQALAANPFPLLIPCHRVICANGQTGAYQGGPAMKRALLARENIPLDAAGRLIGLASVWAEEPAPIGKAPSTRPSSLFPGQGR